MSITIEAVYEGGVLKPAHPLALKEHERVQVTILQAIPAATEALTAAERSYGLLRWTGDPDVLRRVAEDDEFGIMESR